MNVAGIYYSGGEYVVLLEGNEESYVRELPGVILDSILQGEDLVELSTVNLGRERFPVREVKNSFPPSVRNPKKALPTKAT